jgi:small-conductance mechanosensitive channel
MGLTAFIPAALTLGIGIAALITFKVLSDRRDSSDIQADVSLGYDIHHRDAKHHLLSAASKAGFTDPYVLVLELLDHAVSYRVAGFFNDVKNPLSARSALRRHMLDELHLANVEITSPSVVAQRQQPGDTRTLAKQAAQRSLFGASNKRSAGSKPPGMPAAQIRLIARY